MYIDDRQKKQWREPEQTIKDISVELFFETQEHEEGIPSNRGS